MKRNVYRIDKLCIVFVCFVFYILRFNSESSFKERPITRTIGKGMI